MGVQMLDILQDLAHPYSEHILRHQEVQKMPSMTISPLCLRRGLLGSIRSLWEGVMAVVWGASRIACGGEENPYLLLLLILQLLWLAVTGRPTELYILP